MRWPAYCPVFNVMQKAPPQGPIPAVSPDSVFQVPSMGSAACNGDAEIIPAARIEPVSSVSVATIAFGSMWRNMITQLLTPSALAARTYSKFRARKNSARTTPTSAGQPNSTVRNTSIQKLRPKIANMMMMT